MDATSTTWQPFIASGWTVEDDERDAEAGDAIVTPAGVPHAFEVLDGKPSQVVCVVCPPAGRER